MIKIKNSDRNKFSFLNSAVGHSDTRYTLEYIKAIDNWLYSTDGHTLHAVSFSCENGLYRLFNDRGFFLVKIDDEKIYPDVLKVFPPENESFEISLSSEIAKTEAIGQLWERGLYINYKYVFNLTQMTRHWNVHIPIDNDKNEKQILFTTEGAKAVIMPFRPTVVIKKGE